MPLIDPQLKEILVCPNCKSALQEDEAQSKLRCTGCGLAYPVQEGIPVMMIDEAEKPDNWQEQKAAAN